MNDFLKNDFLKNAMNNSLNKLGANVLKTAQSYQRDWRKLAEHIGGRYEQMQVDNLQIDPRYVDMYRGVEKDLAFPRVIVSHKRWTLRVMPIWFVPPPFGPLSFVRCTYSRRSELRLSIAVKRNVELGKAISPFAKPASDGVKHLLKLIVPTFHFPDPTPQMKQMQKEWESLEAVRSGFPEIDNLYIIHTNDASVVKKLFADWRVRESFLKITKLQHFSIDPTYNNLTLSQTISADCKDDVKSTVEFAKATLDRLAADNFIYTDAPTFNPKDWP